jgi:hypothetical protein
VAQDVAVQLPEHLPSVPHRLLAQAVAVTGGQVPAPSQDEAGVAAPFVQLACVQTVELPGKIQVLVLPSHWPLQVPVPLQAARDASGAPVRTLQDPTELVSVHDSHCPSHLELQQTPSTQLPEVHCGLVEQVFPLSRVVTQAPVASQ